MASIYTISTDTRSTCQSGKVDPEKSIAAYITEIAPRYAGGFAVCRLNHAVHIGSIDTAGIRFFPDVAPDYVRDLDQIRLFNNDGELFVWRTGNGFRFRERTDGAGEPCEYVAASQVLWGTHARRLDALWIEAREDRGIRLVIPDETLALPVGEARKLDKRYVLTTHNYIDYNEVGQAGYVDCRFVAIGLEG